MVKNNENLSSPGKREGSAYPYMPLNQSLRLSDAVKDLGGSRSTVTKSMLASHMKENEKSANFSQRIMAAKCFGLIEGRGEYQLSENAKRYYFPVNDSDKSDAALDFLSTPPAFAELIKRFDGDKLPTRDLLANMLHKELGVPDSWKDRAAAFFANSAELVGVIDSEGFLRFNAVKHGNNLKGNIALAPAHPISRNGPEPQNSSLSIGTNVWNFSHKGASVRLETPSELTKPIWEKLNAYVQFLKPLEE